MQKHGNPQNDKENGKADFNKGMSHQDTYDLRKYISEGRRVSNGTVPLNILKFQYPFLSCQLFFSHCIF